jgi:hypothetical protein
MFKHIICITLLGCILAGTTSALSMKQVADKWKGVGGSKSKCSVAVAVAWAESKGNPKARGQNSDSYDRGLWQINSKWHRDVSDSCAYDAKCNAQQAKRISSNGNNWRPWATYKNGLHKRYLNDAKKACGGGGWFDEDENEVGEGRVGIEFSTKWDVARPDFSKYSCTRYMMKRCKPGYKVFTVPNLFQPKCGGIPTDCLPADQPPANRCRPFYQNIKCPVGYVKRTVSNSAQPGCRGIPVCYAVAKPVPQTRSKMLKDYVNKFDRSQFDQSNEDVGLSMKWPDEGMRPLRSWSTMPRMPGQSRCQCGKYKNGACRMCYRMQRI